MFKTLSEPGSRERMRMGDGTCCSGRHSGSLLRPHPLADADTLKCKLAKASLLGEGQDEGSELRYWRDLASGNSAKP